jgi:cation transport protein ChaC
MTLLVSLHLIRVLTLLIGKGPSGENKEYLYMLEDALKGLSRESGDEHVSGLAGRCREIEGGGMVRKDVGGVGEMEEVEK